jgi:chromosome segregation ATPase
LVLSLQNASQVQVQQLREELHRINTGLTRAKKSASSIGSRPSTSGRSSGSPQIRATATQQQQPGGQAVSRELFQQQQQQQQQHPDMEKLSTQAQQEQQLTSSSHSLQGQIHQRSDFGMGQQQLHGGSAWHLLDNQLWQEHHEQQPQQQQQPLLRHLSAPCHHQHKQAHRHQQQPGPARAQGWPDKRQQQQQQQQPLEPDISGPPGRKQQQLQLQIAGFSQAPSRIASSDHLAVLTASTDSSAQQKLDMARQAGHRMHQLVTENQDLRGTVSHLQDQLSRLQAATPGQPSPDAAELLLTNQKLHRELHAKEQAVTAAHAALRNLTTATEDQRLRELQEQVQELKHQLLTRDAGLAAAEAQVKQLHQEKQQQGFRRSGSTRGSGEQPEGLGLQPTAGLLRQISGTLGVHGVHGEQQQQLRQSTGAVSTTSCGSATHVQAALQNKLDQAHDDLAKRAAEVGELRAQLQGMNDKHKAELQKQDAAHERQADVQQQRLEQGRRELEGRCNEVEQLSRELAALQQQQQQGLAGGCGDPQHSVMQEQLQQRTAEVEQMREALQQLHELMGCTSGSPRQYKGASVGNLVIALQRRLQQLLADITSRAAELEDLKQQNAAQAHAGAGTSSRGLGICISNGSGNGAAPGTRVIQAGHDKQIQAKAAKEIEQLQQRCRDLESEKQQCELEVADAVRKLEEAEEHLGQVLVLQESNERLERELQQQQQQVEQQKELVRTLQQHQQRITQAAASGSGSKAFEQLISELQQQLAAAAVQLQQAKQVQERAVQQAEQYNQELVKLRAQKGSTSGQHTGGHLSESGQEVKVLQQRCSELSQQVGALQQQVAEHETKEARLHAAHAQLQEELYALKVRSEEVPPPC